MTRPFRPRGIDSTGKPASWLCQASWLVRFEVLRHRFAALCEEMGFVLQRSAFSANIKERRDFSCAAFDADGEMIAQAAHIPVHLGSMPASVKAAIAGSPLHPGDVVILNDPYEGGTHLPDITLVQGVYRRGRLLFLLANRAHHADVGGVSPGSMPNATEIYQEGLRIPPIRLVRAGQEHPALLALLVANMRNPEERVGDFRAQLASLAHGERRITEMLDDLTPSELVAFPRAVRAYSAHVMGEVIRSIPRGTYAFEDALEEGIPIRARITIGRGRAVVDLRGCAGAVRGPVNAGRAITLSCVHYVFRCLAPADFPANAGAMERLTVLTRPGSVVHALAPSAVCGGNVETSQRIVDVLFGALAKALPGRIPAASQGTMNNLTLGGDGFTWYETIGGGAGAGPHAGGLSGVHTHMTNTRNTPVEAIEAALPVRIEAYRLRRGSGGRGRRRGGEGIERAIRALAPIEASLLTERRLVGPYGLAGGGAGRCGRNTLVRGGRTMRLPSKGGLTLRPGDVLSIETPGGGGHGTPASDP